MVGIRGNLLRTNHQLTVNSQGMARSNILEVPINMLGYQLTTLFDGLGLEPGNFLRPLFFRELHLIIKENKQLGMKKLSRRINILLSVKND